MDFMLFKQAVARQFQRMSTHRLFVTNVSKDDLWTTYLSSFPEGTNPIFRERTQHDCSCCKQFIRNIGNVVAIIDDKIETIWDVTVPGYQPVADALAKLVRSQPIDTIYLHYERSVGTDKNFEELLDKTVLTWDHFHVNLPTQVVVSKHVIATQLGNMRTTHSVFVRALKEITFEAVDTVLELIDQNSLYRGAEHKSAVSEFKKRQVQSRSVPDIHTFAWQELTAHSRSIPESISRIRNTSIGTLLVDLSEGMALEDAVKRFEAMVAPANYKRPTALVTKAMVDKAKQTIEELGLTSALERRYARLEDITINNVLHANRTTRQALGDVFAQISAESNVVSANTFNKVEELTIDKFISDILPKAESLELMVENRHANNMVSLIAPVDPTARNMFKWNNGFSWSYTGDVTDSIKERVKAAGGNVYGEFRCSLSWFNYDDLDLSMSEPGDYTIYFGNRNWKSPSQGMLDVDMNAGHPSSLEPVENIFYKQLSTMRDGVYYLYVHNFRRRQTINVGFEVEIDILGELVQLKHEKALAEREKVCVATFTVKKGRIIERKFHLEQGSTSKEIWGVQSSTFVPVKAVMLSPNCWDDKCIGNKHWFFMLENCRNPDVARGFYNEFLSSELEPHRKVMEMVGSKMKTGNEEAQLSGLGFSSTLRNNVLCRVKGSFNRIIKIVF